MQAWFPGMAPEEAVAIIKAIEIFLFPGGLAILLMSVAGFLR